MTRKLALLALAAAPLLAAGAAAAEDHVVSRQDMAARIDAAESARQRDLQAVDRFLASPEAAAAAAGMGADASRLRAGLAGLSAQEAATLAARVQTLDPVAGLDPDIRTLLVIFLIVAIVILVLQAVD